MASKQTPHMSLQCINAVAKNSRYTDKVKLASHQYGISITAIASSWLVGSSQHCICHSSCCIWFACLIDVGCVSVAVQCIQALQLVGIRIDRLLRSLAELLRNSACKGVADAIILQMSCMGIADTEVEQNVKMSKYTTIGILHFVFKNSRRHRGCHGSQGSPYNSFQAFPQPKVCGLVQRI